MCNLTQTSQPGLSTLDGIKRIILAGRFSKYLPSFQESSKTLGCATLRFRNKTGRTGVVVRFCRHANRNELQG